MPSSTDKRKLRVAILVRKLEVGGAERQALELAKGLARNGHEPTILTFYPGGRFWDEAVAADINVHSIDKISRWDMFKFQQRLIRKLKDLRVEILQTFDTPPGLIGLAARPFVPGLKVIWGVRASNVDLSHYDYSRQLVFQSTRILSRFADRIITNSHAGAEFVCARGYPQNKVSVVHNGIDTDRFMPDTAAGLAKRKELSVSPDELLIGIAARLDPMKDHKVFLDAARLFQQSGRKAKFICVGDGPDGEKLREYAGNAGIAETVIWPGSRNDMPAIYSAMDINTLTSAWGEGFPNTIAESMACGTACVATVVGDSREILLDDSYSIPVGDAEALFEFWRNYADLDTTTRQQISKDSREKICTSFSPGKMVQETEKIYRMLAGDPI
jgi:glycosyltransferase involved in cell wall biosynthesis